MHPGVKIRLAHPELVHDFEEQIAELIGGIVAVFVHPSHGDHLPVEHAPVEPHHGFREDGDDLRHLDRKGGEQFLRLPRREGGILQAGPVVGIEVLVDPARTDAVVQAFQVDRRSGRRRGTEGPREMSWRPSGAPSDTPPRWFPVPLFALAPFLPRPFPRARPAYRSPKRARPARMIFTPS